MSSSARIKKANPSPDSPLLSGLTTCIASNEYGKDTEISVTFNPEHEKIINIPFISPRSFHGIMMRYDTYAHAYKSLCNEIRAQGGTHVQSLKSTHRHLFQALVSQAKGNLEYRRKTFSPNTVIDLSLNANQPFVLYTNNIELQKRTGKDTSTIYRNLQRLMDAGIILNKVNHGTRSDYELHLNPQFLPLDDLAIANPNAQPTGIAESGLAANCKPLNNNKNNFNNIIIPVSYVEMNGVVLSPNPLQGTYKNIYRNTEEQAKFLSEKQTFLANSEKKIQKNPPANCEKTNLRTLLATWLIQYMLELLFPKHNHYPGAIANAIEYAANTYYTGCSTQTELNNRHNALLWRVEAAARWVKRTGFDMSNIYITSYLDVNNFKSGFVKTKKWLAKQRMYDAKKLDYQKSKKRKRDDQKLSEAVNRLDAVYLTGDTKALVREYMKQEEYVRRNIPHLEATWLQKTAYITHNWYGAQNKIIA